MKKIKKIKPIYISTILEKDLPEVVVNKNILKDGKVVGKVIEYNSKTGAAKFEIAEQEAWKEISGNEILISSRKI